MVGLGAVAVAFHAQMDAIAAGKTQWGEIEGELFAPGFVAHMMGVGDVDLAGYREGVGAFMGAFEGYEHRLEAQVADGDLVASRWTWTGTHTGEFNGVAATGREVSIGVMNFIRVADGKVAEFWPSFDAVGLMRQIS
ncbi:ester cyclase [Nocardia sp. NPDC051030]|uniref:ester cyclase n=1 Tax=Nocardia sp. NPDC051030 TaxID=3155162 RepID=UPI0034288E01